MIKGIIFDHDGTLIDTERMHYECWRLILRDYGVEFTLEEYVREHNGVPTSRNADVLIQTNGNDIAATELVARKTAMAHTQFAAQPSPLMPFAAETLQRCFDAGHSLAIATGAGLCPASKLRLSVSAAKGIKGLGCASNCLWAIAVFLATNSVAALSIP